MKKKLINYIVYLIITLYIFKLKMLTLNLGKVVLYSHVIIIFIKIIVLIIGYLEPSLLIDDFLSGYLYSTIDFIGCDKITCVRDGLGEVTDETLEAVRDMFKAEEDKLNQTNDDSSEYSANSLDNENYSDRENTRDQSDNGSFDEPPIHWVEWPRPEPGMPTLDSLNEWFRLLSTPACPNAPMLLILDLDTVIGNINHYSAIQASGESDNPYIDEYLEILRPAAENAKQLVTIFTDRTDYSIIAYQYLDLIDRGLTWEEARDALGLTVPGFHD